MSAFCLLERYVNGRLCYWASGARGRASRDDWSEDVAFAIKFYDFNSAETVLIHACGGEGRVTEHVILPNRETR